nr:immunoglobulin light chain junction region [Macaca mulatta]MOX16791.1 immunoglobulin light chain junction region [Macaca mulatta]MOX16817.1 immunoglobulin light chain junction region [Macaca mulatta]MOX17024.1 immunoglobulin light chain junction region [Macaca mulatta]MOX17367.1 immunoglobulin light chain junction region [Macaca mulatta]
DYYCYSGDVNNDVF